MTNEFNKSDLFMLSDTPLMLLDLSVYRMHTYYHVYIILKYVMKGNINYTNNFFDINANSSIFVFSRNKFMKSDRNI